MRRRKKKLKLGNIFIAVSLVILFSLVLVYFLCGPSSKNLQQEGKKDNKLQENKEEKEQEYQASMVMVGDNLIHSSVYKDASDGKGGYDFRKMYELVKSIIQKYDIAYYNQETVLGGKEL